MIPLLNGFPSHMQILSHPFLMSSGKTIVSLEVTVEGDLPKPQRADYHHQIVLSFVVLRVSCS